MKKKPIMIFASLLAGLILISIAAVLLRPATNTTLTPGQKLKVVAAENFWGNIAAQIGGEHADVTSLISDPASDPHLYESGAKDASALNSANIVIINGLGYDDFMDKLLSAAPNGNRTVINASSVLAAKDGDNPHLWYDVTRVGLVASQITQDFTKKDPTNANIYQKNLNAFLDSLQPTLDAVQTIRTQYPQVPVAYTERVPGYLLMSLGLTVKTPAGFASAIEDGDEPSPADQTAMLSLITQKQIRVLLYNSQADSPAAQAIRTAAAKNNIPVVAVTETIPSTMPSYQAWQQAQITALLQALEATK